MDLASLLSHSPARGPLSHPAAAVMVRQLPEEREAATWEVSSQVSHYRCVYSSCLGQAELVQIHQGVLALPAARRLWMGKAVCSSRMTPKPTSRARLNLGDCTLTRGVTLRHFLSLRFSPICAEPISGSTSQKCLCPIFKHCSGISEVSPPAPHYPLCLISPLCWCNAFSPLLSTVCN